MANIKTTHNYLAIGLQTAPSSAASPSVYLSLSGGSSVELSLPTSSGIGGTYATGRVEANLHPIYDAKLLEFILQRDARGEAPYFTIIQAYDSGMVWNFVDCKINKATFSCHVKEVVKLGIEFYSRSWPVQSLSSQPPSLPPAWISQKITLTLAGHEYPKIAKVVDITINNNITHPRDMLRFGALKPVALPADDITIDGMLTLNAEPEVVNTFLKDIGDTREAFLSIELIFDKYMRTITLPKIVFNMLNARIEPSSASVKVDLPFKALAPDSKTPAISIS